MTSLPFIRFALAVVVFGCGGYSAGWRARDRELGSPVAATATPAPLPRVHVRPTPEPVSVQVFSL